MWHDHPRPLDSVSFVFIALQLIQHTKSRNPGWLLSAKGQRCLHFPALNQPGETPRAGRAALVLQGALPTSTLRSFLPLGRCLMKAGEGESENTWEDEESTRPESTGVRAALIITRPNGKRVQEEPMGTGTGTGEQWLSFTAAGLGPQAFRARHSPTSGPVESWALQRQLLLLQRWRLDSLRGISPV